MDVVATLRHSVFLSSSTYMCKPWTLYNLSDTPLLCCDICARQPLQVPGTKTDQKHGPCMLDSSFIAQSEVQLLIYPTEAEACMQELKPPFLRLSAMMTVHQETSQASSSHILLAKAVSAILGAATCIGPFLRPDMIT